MKETKGYFLNKKKLTNDMSPNAGVGGNGIPHWQPRVTVPLMYNSYIHLMFTHLMANTMNTPRNNTFYLVVLVNSNCKAFVQKLPL